MEGDLLAAFSEKPKQTLKKAVKKGQVDINMRKAIPEVMAMVATAEMVEVNNWMRNEVCEAALCRAGVKPMKMRLHLVLKDEGK
eukprot:3125174-Pyramimonas_sp.AAC.1